jgi:hypothetical protein
LIAWVKEKQDRRKQWMKETEAVLAKLKPQTRLRFRRFGSSTVQEASFQKYLTEEEFGENTLQMEGNPKVLIPLRTVEWLAPL